MGTYINYWPSVYFRSDLNSSISIHQFTYFERLRKWRSLYCYSIVPLLLWLWYNTEHKLEQVDGILEAEGAETKLISNSVLSMRE